MSEMDNEKIVIDETKLHRMKMRIYLLEKENMTINERTDSQMIEDIKKIIETEAKKCY